MEQQQQLWNSLDDRVEFLLRRIAKLAEQRHHIEQDITRSMTTEGSSLSACFEELRAASQCLLPQFAERGAGLARRIAVSAALAESSSRRVKQLDLLLNRVQEARLVADSLREVRWTVMALQPMIDRDELEDAVQLIRKYEKASANLGGHSMPASLLVDESDSEEEVKEAEVSVGVEVTLQGEKQKEIGDALRRDSDVEQGAAIADGVTLPLYDDGNGVVSSLVGAAGDAAEDSLNPKSAIANSSREKKIIKKRLKKKDIVCGASDLQGTVNGSPGDDDSKSTGGDDGDEVERIITNARHAVRNKLMAKFYSAKRYNDKQTLMDTAHLLTLLGFGAESCDMYCTWMCEHTIVALNKMVERELRKIDDPSEVGMSHLALVSTALDLVVATFESEEEFIQENFGDAGLLQLLTGLHSRSTSQCVPVLRDFLKKRQEVLQVIAPSRGRPQSPRKGGSGNSNSSAGASAVQQQQLPSTLDPRRTDQILEEMAHLVSCYHLYWTFAQSKQQECVQRLQDKEGAVHEPAPGVGESADSLWSSRDNPLMNVVQEILGVFVPLQTHYFSAAFEQVLQMQLSALSTGTSSVVASPSLPNTTTGALGGGSNSRKATDQASTVSSHKATTSLITGLTALYNSTTSGGGAGSGGIGGIITQGITGASGGVAVIDEDLGLGLTGVQQLPPITLPDDVFYFLRVSLHRALNTKSTQIISAVFLACGELVQSQLFPCLQGHVSLPPVSQLQQLHTLHEHSQYQQHTRNRLYTIPTRVLRWTAAAQCTVTYTQRLADELWQLSRSHFSGKDMLRFSEQAEDMTGTANEIFKAVQSWLESYAERVLPSAPRAVHGNHLLLFPTN
uniref:COG4 transport protein middle alpha-helical bundle domain-containing protein n=1 Tax=Trypanosoma congolense (strain IL3000) TaxID=1068625 RepID=G0UQW6_TRYCI|nr:conserved hypothetical protein [Trypanosoma congolense IL3000]